MRQWICEPGTFWSLPKSNNEVMRRCRGCHAEDVAHGPAAFLPKRPDEFLNRGPLIEISVLQWKALERP